MLGVSEASQGGRIDAEGETETGIGVKGEMGKSSGARWYEGSDLPGAGWLDHWPECARWILFFVADVAGRRSPGFGRDAVIGGQ